jgi:hypothetical protein
MVAGGGGEREREGGREREKRVKERERNYCHSTYYFTQHVDFSQAFPDSLDFPASILFDLMDSISRSR